MKQMAQEQSQHTQRTHSNPKRSSWTDEARKSRKLEEQRLQEKNLLECLTSANANVSSTAAGHRRHIEAVYHTKDVRNAPVVVVDGYNLLHLMKRRRDYSKKGGSALKAEDEANMRLLQRCKSEGVYSAPRSRACDNISSVEIELLREEVERSVEAYASRKEFQAVVVWDSMGRSEGSEGVVVVRVQSEMLTSAYTAGMEADSHLGEAARFYVERGARYAQVVTSDVDAGTITGSSIYVCSSESFIEEMDRGESSEDEELAAMNSLFFGSNILVSDPETNKTLAALWQQGALPSYAPKRKERKAAKNSRRESQQQGHEVGEETQEEDD
jgi:predicted RNA-binding protein with PIN domain